MKPLDEEVIIEQVFQIVQEVSNLETPPPDMVKLYNSARTWGLGGRFYGIAINLDLFDDLSLNNQDLVETIVHELIHYNGVRGHGQKFQNILKETMSKVLNKIKEVGGEN